MKIVNRRHTFLPSYSYCSIFVDHLLCLGYPAVVQITTQLILPVIIKWAGQAFMCLEISAPIDNDFYSGCLFFESINVDGYHVLFWWLWLILTLLPLHAYESSNIDRELLMALGLGFFSVFLIQVFFGSFLFYWTTGKKLFFKQVILK